MRSAYGILTNKDNKPMYFISESAYNKLSKKEKEKWVLYEDKPNHFYQRF